MSGRPRIGVSGSYGGTNLGDEAILESILSQLRESLDADVTVFTHDAEDTRSRHDVNAVDVRSLTRDESRAEVASLDVFVLGGGGILFDEGADAYLRELRLAQEERIPTMIYAVSAGPLTNVSTRELVRDGLEAADIVTVRDRRARHLLEEVGVEREVIVTADPAVLLRPASSPDDFLRAEGVTTERALVGISVREPGPAAPDLDIEQYHALLADSADYMVDRFDANILFFPLERKATDLQHSHAVISRMQNAARAAVLKGEYTASELLAIVGRLEFALGMRLHFLIFAARQGVPFVALPYASKVEGFIEDVGLEMPALSKVTTGRLLAMIDWSWDRREEVRQRIRDAMPDLEARARENNRLLVDLVTQRMRAKGERNASAEP